MVAEFGPLVAREVPEFHVEYPKKYGIPGSDPEYVERCHHLLPLGWSWDSKRYRVLYSVAILFVPPVCCSPNLCLAVCSYEDLGCIKESILLHESTVYPRSSRVLAWTAFELRYDAYAHATTNPWMQEIAMQKGIRPWSDSELRHNTPPCFVRNAESVFVGVLLCLVLNIASFQNSWSNVV